MRGNYMALQYLNYFNFVWTSLLGWIWDRIPSIIHTQQVWNSIHDSSLAMI